MVSTETDELAQMLTRLKLTAIRDQLDALLDEAARRGSMANCGSRDLVEGIGER